MEEGGVVALLSLVVGVMVIVAKALTPRKLKDVAVDGSKEILEALLSKIDKEFKRLLGEQRAQNVIIQLGIGGAGKTTLIKQLIGDPTANPNVETMNFSVYKRHSTIESGSGDGKKLETSIIIADYRGQDFSTLIRGILDHTRKGKEFRAGNINTIIFLVDIFPPCDNKAELISDQPDRERLRKNIEYWNEDKVQEIFNSFTERGSLKNVVVFVNKCDLLASRNREQLIDPVIQPLMHCIEKHTESLFIDPLIIYGSVKTGEGVWQLLQRILRTVVYA